MDPSANRARSSIDYSASSYDQELSTASKNPSGATRNPSYSASGRIVFSPEMRKSTDSSSDNGDIIRRLVDVGIAPPLNGMSQKPHGEASHPVSDLDTNIIQGPVTAPSISNVVPSCVNNGHVTGGIHQEHEPNPGQHDHGIGRGRGIFPRRGQGSLRFRGRGNRGKGRGFGNQFFHKYDAPPLKKQQLEEVATNTSVVYQVSPE
ncbi:unnamed protein product [Staurois parvus]|uniref:Uncharacterized protein n=1 Tax=Staurois parvus TaxID=386267 RepID=A0ABN9H644_9NEOB|nr:unnamed protein product [Staurois parvus]